MLDTLRDWKLFVLNRPSWKRKREMRRLRALPRYQPGTSDLHGVELEYVDAASFLYSYRAVFDRGIYRFRSESAAPVILDCGANIGLSVIYFNHLYPDARITAFEPDSKVFAVLERNLKRIGASNIQLENSAVWSSAGELDFMCEGADAGRVTALDPAIKKQKVHAVRLRDYLDKPVDFLKLDIEGAEVEVVKDCAASLRNVRTLFVEYHSFESEKQSLPELLTMIREAGFRFFCEHETKASQPFVEIKPNLGMDLQMNIYAFRKQPLP